VDDAARPAEVSGAEAPLKNPAELFARLELAHPPRLLLVDSRPALSRLLSEGRPAASEVVEVEGEAMRSVKQRFDAILVWRENRVGSRAVLDLAAQRLESGGALWVVTAMRKVTGPRTPAAHRLELADVKKLLEPKGLRHDREVRVTAWNVAYRFVKKS
jgi:hypothetical protein